MSPRIRCPKTGAIICEEIKCFICDYQCEKDQEEATSD